MILTDTGEEWDSNPFILKGVESLYVSEMSCVCVEGVVGNYYGLSSFHNVGAVYE